MHIDVVRTTPLRFEDGSPVRAASAVVPFGDGWLIAQDDATHAAWRRTGAAHRVRVLPPIGGHDTFSEDEGTKHLKPDLEAAFETSAGVLLLGSGSTSARMRASRVWLEEGTPRFTVADLTPWYGLVANSLGIASEHVNLEGACPVGEKLRWFNRGNPRGGIPSASVDVDLAALIRSVAEAADPPADAVTDPREYDLGEVNGAGLAVTDAVALDGGLVLLSAAAEDTPNAVDDGPVVATALVLLDDRGVVDVTPLPELDDSVLKVEGLAIVNGTDHGVVVLGVVDADDPGSPSIQVVLDVRRR